jgi:hypothetical protein
VEASGLTSRGVVASSTTSHTASTGDRDAPDHHRPPRRRPRGVGRGRRLGGPRRRRVRRPFEQGAVLAPGATIPVDFPGYREPANNKLKGGYRIVVVRAALARDERATTTITAPKGFKLVTLAFNDASQLGARTENVYVGKPSVRLTLFADRNHVAAGETGHATIYALARRGGF